ncbi:hypothetical protein KY360_05580 [Candidatus Woesearchaeota archaeon]|nr:hypothetical protein [Candidatus Woesearchaeota archaeon]
MGEVSNKTLAALLVVAVVVSLGGTFISLNRLSSLGRVPLVTGLATDIGRVNITITEDLTIDTPENLIYFGEGSVTTPFDYAELHSNGTLFRWSNTTGYMPDPTYANEDIIIIENQGNVWVNVTVITGQNATEYLCTGGDTCGEIRDAQYDYWTDDNETGSCLYGLNESYSTDFIGDGSTAQNVCGALKSDTGTNSVKLWVYLKVPRTAQGAKNDTLTFTSTKSAYQS